MRLFAGLFGGLRAGQGLYFSTFTGLFSDAGEFFLYIATFDLQHTLCLALREFGGSNPALTWRASGFVGGDTEALLDGVQTGTSARRGGSTAPSRRCFPAATPPSSGTRPTVSGNGSSSASPWAR